MPFIEAIITTLIGVFSANALNKRLEARTDKKTNEIVITDDDGKEFARLQNGDVRLEPYDIFSAFIDRLSTNATKQPSKAQIEFTNPFKQDVILTSLSLVPDAVFQTKGKALVKIGANVITINGSSLTDTDGVNIPLPAGGIKVLRTDKIQVFAWNTVDTSTISLTSLVGMGGYLG